MVSEEFSDGENSLEAISYGVRLHVRSQRSASSDAKGKEEGGIHLSIGGGTFVLLMVRDLGLRRALADRLNTK